MAPATVVVFGEDAHARGLTAQRATFAVALAAAAGLSLGACYGGPPHPRYDPQATTSGATTVSPDAGGRPAVMPASAPGVVVAEGLSRRFGDRVALDALDLSLPRGEVFGLLGPNGAGKSTTINLFMGFLRPPRGTLVRGSDCAHESRAVMALDGHMPEEPALFDNLTGRETLSFALSMRGEDRPDRWRRVEGIAERLGASQDLDQLRRGLLHGHAQEAGADDGARARAAGAAARRAHQRPRPGDRPRGARAAAGAVGARGDRRAVDTCSTVARSGVCHRLGVIVRGRLRALGDADAVRAQAGDARDAREPSSRSRRVGR
ncbi:MAG: ATP-binding cassette domain-containing protein [Polyangiales bacterium]